MTTVGPAKATGVTAREAEVLALLGRRFTNVEIADELFISVRTVESHVSALLRKLQLSDRRSLARHADAVASTSSVGHGTLPTPITPFIGRTAERTELIAALIEQRMVTATGPGGVGKTRLALSVAAELVPARRDGGWFVDLVQVSDPAMVIATVAEVVGVPEQSSTSVDAALVAMLAERDALLVLDNCEHVLDGVRHCVEQIVVGCPNVTVLATSRTRLMLPYERVFAVPGLSVTDDGGDAVALFAARIGAITGEVEGVDTRRVAALCRALDGMALAIELAAARYPTLGFDGLETGPRRPSATAHRGLPDARSPPFLTRCHRLELRPPRPERPGAVAQRRRVRVVVRRRRRHHRRRPRDRTHLLSPTAWLDSPTTASSSSTVASRPAIGRWRRSASTASSNSTPPESSQTPEPATSNGAAPPSRRSLRPSPMMRGATASTTLSTTSAPLSCGLQATREEGRRRHG